MNLYYLCASFLISFSAFSRLLYLINSSFKYDFIFLLDFQPASLFIPFFINLNLRVSDLFKSD